jgi:undecaprenyl diphosphate synthase
LTENITTYQSHLTECDLQSCLDCAQIPDPDLIFRTAGEQRVSNFPLWEAAYAEIHFSPKFSPDFGPEDLRRALHAYSRRRRTYGAEPQPERVSQSSPVSSSLHPLRVP